MRHPWIIRDRGAACRQRGHGNLWTEAVTQHYSYRLGNPETQRGILSEQWPLEPGRRMLRRVRADDEEDPLSW